MQLPLRLQLNASRTYLVFLVGGHILAGVAVCLLPWPGLLRAGLILLLGMLLLRQWHAVSRRLPALVLRGDGQIEVLGVHDAGLARVVDETVVWPWLVVLHLHGENGRLKPLLIFPDGLVGADAHRQLRMWLRWAKDLPA